MASPDKIAYFSLLLRECSIVRQKQRGYHFPILIMGVWILILACGCEQEKIQVYRVAKEKVPSPSKLAATTPAPQERIEWTVPAGWEEKEPSAMRDGSITISGENGAAADLSIVSLSGGAGGVLANVNRWRDQLNLESITEAQLSQISMQLDVLGRPALLVDFSGDEPVGGEKRRTRVLAAILPHDSSTWFFKMTGDETLVGAQKERFVQFVKTVRFSGSTNDQ